MEYLHTMIRVSDIDASLNFFCDGLGLKEVNRKDSEKGRFTLVFLASPDDLARSGLKGDERPLPAGLPMIELTHNWDEAGYDEGRNFGHLAYRVDNVYDVCQRLMDMGVSINRPPRDGHMAFVRSPDNISIELLQKGEHLSPAEPWASMPNTGHW
ncbi:VOC family protein [Fretibacter rubidus]|uniref:VOC family protein n=1 Tax=Fretibacter rubidus TaxID=570162 RepID=UPI00352A3C8C